MNRYYDSALLAANHFLRYPTKKRLIGPYIAGKQGPDSKPTIAVGYFWYYLLESDGRIVVWTGSSHVTNTGEAEALHAAMAELTGAEPAGALFLGPLGLAAYRASPDTLAHRYVQV